MTIDESETRTMALKRENENLTSSLEELGELVNHLKYMPEDVANGTLQKLRATSDPSRLLQSIKEDVPGFRLSDHTKLRSILPPMPPGAEFELMKRYPIAFPKIAPLEDNTFQRSPRVNPARIPQMDSWPDSKDLSKFLSTQASRQYVAESSASVCDNQMPVYNFQSSTKRAPNQTSPEPATRYWDRRLDHLNIAFWTTVPVTSQFAAGAISLYLETDQPIAGLFDAHVFVSNLVDCKLQFCSPFLVSSLLSFACVSTGIILLKSYR